MAVLFREILFSFVLRLYYICGQFVLHLKASLLLRSICITFEGLITIVFNTDLIRDTRYLCTRFRIDGLKAKSRAISGGKQMKKLSIRVTMVELVYSLKTRRRFNSHAKCTVRAYTSLPAVTTSAVGTTVYKKVSDHFHP